MTDWLRTKTIKLQLQLKAFFFLSVIVRYLIVFKTPNQKQEIDLTKNVVLWLVAKPKRFSFKKARGILELNKVAPFLSRSFHHLRNFSFMFNINNNNDDDQKLRSRGWAEVECESSANRERKRFGCCFDRVWRFSLRDFDFVCWLGGGFD